jgi:hypothetical protein
MAGIVYEAPLAQGELHFYCLNQPELFTRFRYPDSLSGEVGMLRWRPIKVFEKIAPDREANGDLSNRIAIAIARTRASGAPRLNAIKPDGYWRLFHQ